MLPITIDISGIIDELGFSKEETNAYSKYLLDTIADNYMNKWENLVNDNLHSTRDTYKTAMSMEYEDDQNVVFILEGKGENRLAIMLESGADPFDQKEGFKRSDKAKNKGTDQWYLTVPFRIATAEALAESSQFSGQMTKTVQNLVKKEGVLTAANMPEELKVKGIRAEIKTSTKNYPAYVHRSYKFEGLQHSSEKYHGKYVMFRRVSKNSDENLWIHRGFKPLNLMEKALDEINIDQIYKQVTSEFVNV